MKLSRTEPTVVSTRILGSNEYTEVTIPSLNDLESLEGFDQTILKMTNNAEYEKRLLHAFHKTHLVMKANHD